MIRGEEKREEKEQEGDEEKEEEKDEVEDVRRRNSGGKKMVAEEEEEEVQVKEKKVEVNVEEITKVYRDHLYQTAKALVGLTKLSVSTLRI